MTCSSFVPDLLCVHTLVMWIYFIAGTVQPIMITCRCNPWECLDSAPPVKQCIKLLMWAHTKQQHCCRTANLEGSWGG